MSHKRNKIIVEKKSSKIFYNLYYKNSHWLNFFIFFIANILLAYFQFSVEVKIWISFIGLVFPFLVFITAGKTAAEDEKPIYLRELFPGVYGWEIFLFACLSIVPRLYQLTSLSCWPFMDDGFSSFYAIEQLQNWSWHFFYSFCQIPPLFFWSLTLFFKLFPPSLFSLWLYPAVISFLTVAVGYLAVKKLFSKSFAIICVFLLGFSFWPLFIGRICIAPVLILFLEISIFWLMARVALSKSKDDKKITFLLGLFTGLGFFISISWILIATPVILFIFYSFKNSKINLKQIFGFLTPFFLFVGLFLFFSIQEQNGRYIEKLWVLRPGMDILRQCLDIGLNIKAIFWGADWRLSYSPVWGGMLNPLLTSLFLIGILECYRFRKTPLIFWTLIVFILFLTPITVAKGFDTYRISQIIPLLVFIIAIGFQTLLSRLRVRNSSYVAAVFFLFSASLDYYHLFIRFNQIWGTPGSHWSFKKSETLFRAFQILNAKNQMSGPGAVLSEFRTNLADATLTAAVFPFDSCRNPRLTFRDAKWVAIIVDSHYKPFLCKKFTEGKWYWLGKKIPYGGWMLGVIPIQSKNRALLEQWFKANEALQPATSMIVNARLGESQSDILEKIFQARNFMKGDTFLESCFWEKVLIHRTIDQDAEGCLEAIKEGLKNGYPLPELFNEEGVILTQMGRYVQARRAFQRALHSEFNLTPALQNLQALDYAGK